MKRRLLLFFILFSSFAFGQNNIYRSGGITQTIGAPTFTPGASGNVVAIDTVTGEWYVNPNRLSGASWISAGYRLTNISGSVPPAYTPTAHQSHFVVNAANQLYYWNGSAWQSIGGGGGSTDALRLKFIVVNKSGGTINKGEVVYVSGAQGNRVAVKKALASVDSLSANTLGVMDETVANNNEGYCVAEGLISGINTSAFTEGAALYLSPTTAGGITQTKTTAPDHLVLIGYCVKSNAGSGEISVHIQNGYELDELHDVYLPAPSNGQVLTYNTTNKRWEAATVADQSATNELQTIDTFSLSGQTLSASLSSDAQPAKTVTLPVTNVTAGTGISVSSTTGNYTVTNSAPDQTVSIANGGGIGVTGSYPSFTLTATDQSITNEIQRLDTFSLSGQTLRASLLNDGVAASSVTLPIVDVVAGTNVTVSKANGIATVSATGGGGGGSPAGSAGEVQFNSTPAGSFAASSNLAWDNTNSRLNIGAPTSTIARLNIKSAGNNSSSHSLRITDSGNTELVRFSDNGYCGFNITTPSARIHARGTASDAFKAESTAADLYNQFISTSGTGEFGIWNDAFYFQALSTLANGVRFFGSNDAGSRMQLSQAGNLSVGLFSDAARIIVQGASNTSTTYSLIVTNSGGSTTTPAICAQNNQKVGIGTNSVDAGATLEVDGTTGGILFPRLTTTQRDALTGVNGLMIYNTTDNKFQGYANGAWVDLH